MNPWIEMKISNNIAMIIPNPKLSKIVNDKMNNEKNMINIKMFYYVKWIFALIYVFYKFY